MLHRSLPFHVTSGSSYVPPSIALALMWMMPLAVVGCSGSPVDESPTPEATTPPVLETATPEPSTPIPPTPTATPAPETPTPVLVTPTPGPPPYLGQETAQPPYAEGEVLIEHVSVPSFKPAANPAPGAADTGPAESPDAYDNATFTRYRYENSTIPVEVILVGIPGFQGGNGDYDYMGRTLAKLGEGRIEVWAIDRRSNQLEDHLGTEAAESETEPTSALNRGLDYYFRGGTEADESGQNRQFQGFVSNDQIPYFSEWGLDLTLRDAWTVMQLVPAEKRKEVVFLAGHSLGGSLVQHFAAWDFDGDPNTLEDAGYHQIAGLLLLDGASDPNPERVTSQTDYEATLVDLRSGESKRTSSFAGLTADVNVLLELFALGQSLGPAQEAPLAELYEVPGVNVAYLNTLYGNGRYTYRAMLGLAVDDNFQTVYVFQSSAGFLTGGPVESYRRGNNTYYRAVDKDGGTLYGWLDYNEMTDEIPDIAVEEGTHIDDVAYACFKGPSNFTEWYFPARMSVDLGPVADFQVNSSGGDWRWEVYKLASIHSSRVDVPVLGFFSNDTMPESGLIPYRDILAPTLRNGEPRSEGFEIIPVEGYEHLDVLLADLENPGRPNVVLSRLSSWFTQFGLLGTGNGVAPDALDIP